MGAATSIASFIVQRQSTGFKVQTFLTVFFVFAFCLIRCIEFFSLANGLESQTGDYILVVLPTFLYFSSFVQLIATWIALATFSLNSLSNSPRFVTQLTLIVNIVLYALFILIVLIFNFNPPSTKESCGNRLLYPVDNSVQKAISVVYAAFISGLSLLAGLAFIAFGAKLFGKFKDVKSLNAASFRKIATVTIVCTASFLLHCLFIFLLILLSDPPIAFVFIGFVITEVLPAAYLLSMQVNYRKAVTVAFSSVATSTNLSSTDTTSSTSTSNSVRLVNIDPNSSTFSSSTTDLE
jgi:hypothetical protein